VSVVRCFGRPPPGRTAPAQTSIGASTSLAAHQLFQLEHIFRRERPPLRPHSASSTTESNFKPIRHEQRDFRPDYANQRAIVLRSGVKFRL